LPGLVQGGGTREPILGKVRVSPIVIVDRVEEVVCFLVVHFCIGEPDGVFVVPV